MKAKTAKLAGDASVQEVHYKNDCETQLTQRNRERPPVSPRQRLERGTPAIGTERRLLET